VNILTTNYVLKKIARVHCAKGPANCRNCKKYAKGRRFGLLDTIPDEHPMVARPMIEVEIDGERTFVPYEVIAYFNTLEDAQEYAIKKGITFEILPDK